MDARLLEPGTLTADAGTMSAAAQTSATAARTSLIWPLPFAAMADDHRRLGSGTSASNRTDTTIREMRPPHTTAPIESRTSPSCG